MIRSGLRPCKRVFSTHTASVPFTDTNTQPQISIHKDSLVLVAAYLQNSPSSKFRQSISTTHFNSVVKANKTIATQLNRLVNDRNYSQLLESLDSVASSLSREEFTFFTRKLIDYQTKLVLQLASLKSGKSSKVLVEQAEFVADDYRKKIRNLYSSLLFGNVSVYDRKLRQNWPQSAQILTLGDYENLIVFEYANNKLDLANKWFERFDMQFLPHQYTESMWDVQFKINGGDPRLWRVYKNELFVHNYKVAQSGYHKTPFNELLAKFLRYNKLDSQIHNIIHCLGYHGNVTSLVKLIQDKYGMNSTGKLVATKDIPDISVLTAIVTSLAYNERYFESMAYINGFQTHFNIDLGSAHAKQFWNALLKWTDMTTRFNKDLVLSHFTKTYCPKAKGTVLEDLLEDANFDYERYLQYLKDLQTKREQVMKNVWSLYQESTLRFSLPAYKVYLIFLRELKLEEDLYEMLRVLGRFYHQYKVPSSSFNAKYLGLNSTHESIHGLYGTVLGSLMNLKRDALLLGQVGPLIDEWALDDAMKQQMAERFNRQLPKLQKEIEKQREEEMVRQRLEDEGLLELF